MFLLVLLLVFFFKSIIINNIIVIMIIFGIATGYYNGSMWTITNMGIASLPKTRRKDSIGIKGPHAHEKDNLHCDNDFKDNVRRLLFGFPPHSI